MIQGKRILIWPTVITLGLLLVAGVVAWAENNGYLVRRPLDPSVHKGEIINQIEATQFAKTIGARLLPETAISEGKLEERNPGQRKLWSFEFSPKKGILELEAESGQPVIYISFEKISEVRNSGNSDTIITKEDTLSCAKEEFEKLGAPWPEGQPSVDLIDKGQAGIKFWHLRWPRLYQGYAFRDDVVAAQIDAYKGELISYNYHYFSQAPSTVDLKVTKDEARKVAEDIMMSQGNAEIKSPGNLYLINPNYRWRTDKEFIKYPSGETRLAWVFDFSLQHKEGDGVIDRVGEIWIDAENKEVLGGVISA
jgi:hypothetical protein